MNRILVLMTVALLAFGITSCSEEEETKKYPPFTLTINGATFALPVSVTGLFVRPGGSSDWGQNILDEEVDIPANTSVTLAELVLDGNVSHSEGGYDLRIETNLGSKEYLTMYLEEQDLWFYLTDAGLN